MPVYRWSQNPALNASADPGIGWQEGQAPSSINDSARAMMAASAQYRDDISGALVTGGTSAAYILTTYSGFTSAAYLANQLVAFTPHVTNAAGPVTMTVDSQANIPLRSAPGKELPAGTIIQGTPYCAVYNQTDNALYLQSFYGSSPYLIPLGASMEFWLPTAPNSSFAFPFGQAISRTTYATLFAAMGTTFGTGDGSTTFNIPDLRGRVTAGVDNMGGTAASRLTTSYFGANASTLGAVGGGESHTLITAELPSHTHANSLTDPGHVHTYQYTSFGLQAGNAAGYWGLSNNTFNASNNTGSATTGISINNAAQGGGGAHAIVQPTITCNRILRII